MSNEYDGWTNFETFAVNLWLDNQLEDDEGARPYWNSIAQSCWNEVELHDDMTRESATEIAIAEILREHHLRNKPELAGVYEDLLSKALDNVNWREIARYYVDNTVQKTTVG
jgi:hypothetical protein